MGTGRKAKSTTSLRTDMCLTRQAEMPPCGYKRRSRSRARHGRSTSSTGSQSANVGSREGDFGFSPDSGRGPGVALTGSFDPIETLRSRIISWHQAHVSQVCVMIQGFSTRTSEWVGALPESDMEKPFRFQHSQCPTGSLGGLGDIVIRMGGGDDGTGLRIHIHPVDQ